MCICPAPKSRSGCVVPSWAQPASLTTCAYASLRTRQWLCSSRSGSGKLLAAAMTASSADAASAMALASGTRSPRLPRHLGGPVGELVSPRPTMADEETAKAVEKLSVQAVRVG